MKTLIVFSLLASVTLSQDFTVNVDKVTKARAEAVLPGGPKGTGMFVYRLELSIMPYTERSGYVRFHAKLHGFPMKVDTKSSVKTKGKARRVIVNGDYTFRADDRLVLTNPGETSKLVLISARPMEPSDDFKFEFVSDIGDKLEAKITWSRGTREFLTDGVREGPSGAKLPFKNPPSHRRLTAEELEEVKSLLKSKKKWVANIASHFDVDPKLVTELFVADRKLVKNQPTERQLELVGNLLKSRVACQKVESQPSVRGGSRSGASKFSPLPRVDRQVIRYVSYLDKSIQKSRNIRVEELFKKNGSELALFREQQGNVAVIAQSMFQLFLEKKRLENEGAYKLATRNAEVEAIQKKRNLLPEIDKPRVWIDRTGKFKVFATLKVWDVKNKFVILVKSNKKEIKVSESSLSHEDLESLKSTSKRAN